MVLSSAANAVPQTSCVINGNIYYGSDNQLLCWQVEALENPTWVADLDGHVEALTQASEHHLVAGTSSGLIYTVDIANGQLEILDKLPRPITCVASNYNPGDDPEVPQAALLYAAGCMDGTAYTYNASSKEKIPRKTRGYALCAAFCENLLVLGGTASKLLVIDLASNEELWLEGHEGWVRGLSFRRDSPSSYTLASGSQERYIRLWNFVKQDPSTVEAVAENLLLTNAKAISNWKISFEALLMGHDDWVVSVAWDPAGSRTLLSASSDSSLIIWMAESSDLWTPDHRLGDVSNWGASTATGTSGGFWSALWLGETKLASSQNNASEVRSTVAVATVTKSGSFRVWTKDSNELWQPQPGPTGHFQEVTDVAWFQDDFVLSTSLDQTTRLWHLTQVPHLHTSALTEIGRPQIHGYDMMAIAPIDERTFVSAGDEKVMRVFELPRQVAEQMIKVADKPQRSENDALATLPLVAGVPALGLSNKPEIDENVLDTLPEKPREDHLQRLTLWPEVEKLYGHGFEISCLAVSDQLKTIVSCSRANTEQHARLKFFDTKNYHEITKHNDGPAHSLTVTRLAVSPDGKRVISVSRDRKFMITNIESQEVEIDFPKAHTRIVWDAAWCDNNEEFVTGSRDKQIKKWRRHDNEVELLATLKFENPVTAVAAGGNWVAVGEESGRLSLWDSGLSQQIGEFQLAHRINRLAMNVSQAKVAAACGHTVQVLDIPKKG